MISGKKYNAQFYENQRDGSRRSAKKVIPILLDVLSPISVNSAVDFGCGIGGWLAELKCLIPDVKVLGLDFGDASSKQFFIDINTEFKSIDLSCPIDLHKRYDVAFSLECAEHLPSECAKTFVSNICNHSDIVLFSAAIPGQGGTEHINERPASYWVDLFEENGYQVYDVVRPKIWGDKEIDCWYRQNILLFIKKDAAVHSSELLKNSLTCNPINLAHPDMLHELRRQMEENNNHLISKEFVKKKIPFASSIYSACKKRKK